MRSVCLAAALALCATACGRYSFDPVDDAGAYDPFAASIPSWTSGTRLRAKVADFGGGAIERMGWFDSELGLDCTLDALAPDGNRYCFPVATNTVFTDAGCTSRVGIWSSTGGTPQPTLAADSQIVGSSFVTRTYPLGTLLSVGSYYTGSPGSCNGPYPQGSATIYGLGPELDPATTFVRITDARVGTGRLLQDGWQGSDGSQYFFQLFDGTLQLPCAFRETTQGMRCVTNTDGAGFYFSDAACTVPLAEPGPLGATEGVNYTEPCGLTHRYERGAAFTGMAYTKYSGTCGGSLATGRFSVGLEIDPAIFVGGTAIIGNETGRLRGNGVTAIDGARVRTDWRDTMRGNERCSVTGGPGFGGTRCLPTLTASLGDYNDAACTVPIGKVDAAYLPSGACPVPYILSIDMRGDTLHPVDATAQVPTQRFAYGFSCLSMSFDAAASYVVGAAPLSFDSFALATDRVE